MLLTLHFHPLASFCWKALIALYENDTPFAPNIVDLGNVAERDRRGRGLHERVAEICVLAQADEIQLEQHPDVRRRCA